MGITACKTLPKIIVTLSEDIASELREYVKREYSGKHGAISIVVEEALRRFLEEKTGKRLT